MCSQSTLVIITLASLADFDTYQSAISLKYPIWETVVKLDDAIVLFYPSSLSEAAIFSAAAWTKLNFRFHVFDSIELFACFTFEVWANELFKAWLKHGHRHFLMLVQAFFIHRTSKHIYLPQHSHKTIDLVQISLRDSPLLTQFIDSLSFFLNIIAVSCWPWRTLKSKRCYKVMKISEKLLTI